jgi:hypothetical protein
MISQHSRLTRGAFAVIRSAATPEGAGGERNFYAGNQANFRCVSTLFLLVVVGGLEASGNPN